MEIFSGLQKVHSNDQEHDWSPCHTHRGGCIVLPGKKMLTFLSKSVFSVQETHGRALRAGNRLIANSQDAGWRSLHAAIIEEGPFTATEPPIGHPMLIYHLTRPTEVSRKIEGGPGNRQLIGPRRICLTPGEATTRWEHHGHPRSCRCICAGRFTRRRLVRSTTATRNMPSLCRGLQFSIPCSSNWRSRSRQPCATALRRMAFISIHWPK